MLNSISLRNSGARARAPLLVGAGAAALVVISSFATWAIVDGQGYTNNEITRISIKGSGGDGEITFILGGLAAVLILLRLTKPRSSGFVLGIATLFLLINGVMGIGNWLDLRNIPGADQGAKFFHTGVQVGWGLVVMTSASFIGALAAGYQLWQDELR